MSPYNYSFNNPIVFNDPSGMEGEYPIHEVKKGENLTGIAKENGVELSVLLQHNTHIKNADIIQPGDQILIPKIALDESLIGNGQSNMPFNFGNSNFSIAGSWDGPNYGSINLTLGTSGSSTEGVTFKDVFETTKTGIELGMDYLSKNFEIRQNAYATNFGEYGRVVRDGSSPYFSSRSSSARGVVSFGDIDNVNKNIGRFGYAYDAVNISTSWIDVYSKSQQLDTITNNDLRVEAMKKYKDARTEASQNTALTLTGYLLPKIATVTALYGVMETLRKYYETKPEFRNDMRNTAIEGFRRSKPGSKDYNNYLKMIDKYSPKIEGAEKMYFKSAN